MVKPENGVKIRHLSFFWISFENNSIDIEKGEGGVIGRLVSQQRPLVELCEKSRRKWHSKKKFKISWCTQKPLVDLQKL